MERALQAFGWRGLFQMRPFSHVQVLAGAGVGGGSLTYANTLPIPKRGFYSNPAWQHLADWESKLAPHYQEARRMLVYAFASEVIDRIKVDAVAEQVRRHLFQALPERMPERRGGSR